MDRFKMNKSDGGGEFVVARKKSLLGLRPNGVKEKDDDLHLFKEMHKREKDRVVSLLQPVSEEFESNGHNSLYGMAHGKFHSENGKNDYDWLKTPPATPLFASLEMEATHAPELALHRELPIIQLPIIKSTGISEAATKAETETSKSPTSKPKGVPRHTTRNSRLSSSSTEKKNIKNRPILNHKINQTYPENTLETPKKPSFTRITTKPVVEKKESDQLNVNMLASDFNKSIGGLDSTTKPSKSRNKSTTLTQLPEYSDETPSNLKTDRSCSVSRIRASASTQTQTQTPSFTRRLEPIMQSNRVSNTRSVSRIRKQETDQNVTGNSQKEKTQQGNKPQVLGSRMVDRVMNARMSSMEEKKSKGKLSTSMNESSDSRRVSIEDKQSKIKFNTSLNEASGFGRLMSKSSLDMAMKHMDFKRDSSVAAKNEFTARRRSVSVSVSVSKRT